MPGYPCSELIRLRASAGAGKTYQLSLRYLNLLKSSGEPGPQNLRRIVAITFTNKAAEEMKERILRFLKEIALETPFGRELSQQTGLSPQESGAWLETILLHYSDFRVRTIDSLLFAILKALSFELGLIPGIEVSFNHEEVLNESFNSLLAGLSEKTRLLWEKALETFLGVDEKGGFYPEPGLRWRLFQLYPKIKGDIKQFDLKKFKKIKEEAETAYREFCEVTKQLREDLNGNLIRGLTEDKPLTDVMKRSILWKDINEVFKKGSRASEEEKKLFSETRADLLRKLEKFSLEMAYSRLSGYVPLLCSLKERTEEICRREGIIPGSEYWTVPVSRALRDESVLLLVCTHFGADLLHFLFDEFQDTSRPQWEALYPLFMKALSRSGSLFVVGDVKQAIYRWRGGDWNLFEEILDARYFPSVKKLRDETLPRNFRSHPELVKFFNTLFRPLTDEKAIFEKISQMVLGEEAFPEIRKEFASNIAQAFKDFEQEAQNKTTREGIVRIYKAEGSKETVSALIKEKFIEELKAEWEKRKDSSGKIPIAVLVRSNSTGEEISSWLMREGIPVIAENALRLKISPVVKGILNFLTYLYHPDDQVALYGFLASGLLEDGPRNEEELARGWLEGSLSKWQTSVRALKEKLKPLLKQGGLYELVFGLLEALKIFERLEGDLLPQRVFIERLLEVTHRFEQEEGPSLAKFLDFWESGGLEERVGLPENINAVRVLTIHKAKGLEFPVVFIPFTDWRLQDLAPIEVHEGYLIHLKTPLPEELEKLRLKLRAEEAQELLNLFYVAVTRAEEALYLFLTLVKGGGVKPVSCWIETLIEESGLGCRVQNLS